MNNNLLYKTNESPKSFKEWALYSIQQLLSVFVATTLISTICGTPVSACLLGACVGTLLYQIITKFRSPIFVSSCGATVSAVTGALAMTNIEGHQNYLMVAVGGLIILIIYLLFAVLVMKKGTKFLDKLFPPTVVGAVTMVIGLNLATFINGYTNNSGTWEVLLAIFTMFIIAVSSHYFKGFLKTIPFLIGLLSGYIVALILTVAKVHQFIDFELFNPEHWRWYPDITFLKWVKDDFSWKNILDTLILFVPVSICALLEHYSDHKCLSNIIDQDLTKDPGLSRTLIGNGVASSAGSIICGLPVTSYGESIATIGFSRVASVKVLTVTAIILGILSFFAPITAFISSIPSCVFGGCALILYGYISASGLKTILNNKVDLENNKNLIIVSVILTSGVSGIFLFSNSFTGVSLSMVLGVLLNIVLRCKKNRISN